MLVVLPRGLFFRHFTMYTCIDEATGYPYAEYQQSPPCQTYYGQSHHCVYCYKNNKIHITAAAPSKTFLLSFHVKNKNKLVFSMTVLSLVRAIPETIMQGQFNSTNTTIQMCLVK